MKKDNQLKTCVAFLCLLISFLFYSASIAQDKFSNITAQHHTLPWVMNELTEENPIDVLHYTVSLQITPETKSIKGVAQLKIRFKEPFLESFFLNLIDLDVDSLFLEGQALNPTITDSYITIPCKNVSSVKDTVLATIHYSGKPGNDGFGGFIFNNNYIYTMGEGLNSNPPSAFRYWVPSNDRPDDKATLDINVTVPTPLQVISNGLLDRVTEKNNLITYSWKETHPIATYLIAISVGEFSSFTDKYLSVNSDTIPLEYYVFPQDLSTAMEDWKDVGTMMAFFEEKFGPYPFDKYGMVEVPIRGAMEHQSMTSYSNALITGDHRYDYVVVHELAHQWWGNLVTLATWEDIWLNEGFASYCEALYFESLYGEKALQDYMSAFKNTYLKEVARRGNFSIYNPEYLWGGTIYDKGAWVLHMLRWNLGDSLFWSTMKNYAMAFSYKNSTTQDFQDIAETISEQDLDWFFDQWIFKSGFPDLDISWNITWDEQSSYDVELLIQQTQSTENPFRIPLEILFETSDGSILDTLILNEKDELFSFQFSERPDNLIIDPNNWLLKKVTFISQPLPSGFTVDSFNLAQNYPNPFLPDVHGSGTQITFQLAMYNSPVPVSVKIFDILGREVKTITNKNMRSGLHTVTWDGLNNFGNTVPSGIYFYQLTAGSQRIHKKLSLLRR